MLLMVVVVAASAYREQVSAATRPDFRPAATETMPTYKIIRTTSTKPGEYHEAKVDGYALVRCLTADNSDLVLVFER